MLLVEDHAILREGLRALLTLEPDLDIVGEADSAVAGKSMAETSQPHVVIMDIALPGESGLVLIPVLKQQFPDIRVLVLTAHWTDEYVRTALEVGADGYILKDSNRSELIAGVRAVLDGRRYFSSAVTNRMVAGYLGRAEVARAARIPLTAREQEVLKLIALAHSTKAIAAKLHLSAKTVEKHRSNLMRKLALRNTAALTLYAVKHRLVPVDVIGQPRIGDADGAANEQ